MDEWMDGGVGRRTWMDVDCKHSDSNLSPSE